LQGTARYDIIIFTGTMDEIRENNKLFGGRIRKNPVRINRKKGLP